MKKVFVTGGSGGIGFSVVQLFLSNGYEVIASYSNNINTYTHPNLLWVRMDLSNPATLEDLRNVYDSADIFVHCAGIAPVDLMGSYNVRELQKAFNVNVISAIYISNQLLPLMYNRGFGRIILLGSIIGSRGGRGLGCYAATKSALMGFVLSANREIPHSIQNSINNVTINLVSPGYTNTQMTSQVPKTYRDSIIKNSVLKDFLNVNDIARVIQFLALEESNSISGIELSVNGGQTL